MKIGFCTTILIGASIIFFSCKDSDTPEVTNPIRISSPSPTETISKVELSESQVPFVAAGNEFAIKCLKALFDNKNMVFSPLSLQYALALTANGASGETASEIVETLGFSEDKPSMNAFCNLLLKQLPAVDTDVELKLADAVIMSDRFSAQESFRQIAENMYYSPVEYASSSNPGMLVARINEWAGRNTNGLINPLIEENDIDGNFAAAILNALYFKAKWRGAGVRPVFTAGSKLLPFILDGGGSSKVTYMSTESYYRYGKLGNNGILELPYANGKFVMYVILPDAKGGNGIASLLSSLGEESLSSAIASMSADAVVHVRMPMFETTGSFKLTQVLESLGISRAFNPECAEFDLLAEEGSFYIQKILQKARIKVTEWGTEAAAATMVEIGGTEAPGQVEEIYFSADHPFVYLIAEKTSGVILFEGIFNGVN